MKSKMVQVGVAWKKTTFNEKQFVSIIVTNPMGPDYHFSLWPNSYKEKEGQPDYILYKSNEDRTEAKSEAKPQAKSTSDFPEESGGSQGDDDIPF